MKRFKRTGLLKRVVSNSEFLVCIWVFVPLNLKFLQVKRNIILLIFILILFICNYFTPTFFQSCLSICQILSCSLHIGSSYIASFIFTASISVFESRIFSHMMYKSKFFRNVPWEILFSSVFRSFVQYRKKQSTLYYNITKFS